MKWVILGKMGRNVQVFGRNGVKCAVLEVKWALFVAKF